MIENYSNPVAKKARYIASIIYLLVFSFIVGGSYINQQTSSTNEAVSDTEIAN